MSNEFYKQKYLKYKHKYIELKGGNNKVNKLIKTYINSTFSGLIGKISGDESTVNDFDKNSKYLYYKNVLALIIGRYNVDIKNSDKIIHAYGKSFNKTDTCKGYDEIDKIIKKFEELTDSSFEDKQLITMATAAKNDCTPPSLISTLSFGFF